MPSFKYVARDGEGNRITGLIAARDTAEVRVTLRSRDLYVTSVAEQPTGAQRTGRSGLLTWRSKVRLGDLVIMSRQLATLVHAGIPIVESLQSVAAQAENLLLARTLQDLRLEVLSGISLSEAMRKHSKVFTETYISLVQAGEVGGLLEQTLEIAAEQFDKEAELREKVKSALLYPLIVVVAAVAVVAFMLLVIVPVFANVYAQFHAQLPPITRLLVAMSAVIMHDFWLVGLALIGAILALRRYVRTEQGRRQCDRLKLRLPLLIGALARKVAIARFARTLGAALQAGVPILRALTIAAQTAGNMVIADAVVQVAAAVQQGAALSIPMQDCGQFPPLVVRMIAAGEQSGSLDEMLEEVARFYNRDIEYTVQKLTRLLEPTMTVLVGGIVLFVLLALYMPIFNLTRVIRK